MSFALKVKQELANIEQMPECCFHAMTYGMLLFGRTFSPLSVSLLTEHECVAKRYASLIKRTTGVTVQINVSNAGKYTASILNENDRQTVLSAFSVSGNETFYRINRANLLNECGNDETEDINCCNSSFLRGAFLSCGTITDPNKGYHLEYVVPYRTLSLDLMKILTEYGLKAKHMLRRSVNVIYLKDSESIVDLLNIIGAKLASFDMMNIKIYKDIRNSTNRKTNFNYANISRTVCASYDQIEKINLIKQSGYFDSMDIDLQKLALLRLENPDSSLSELGEFFDPPLTRSAVNHRMKKIVSIYDKLKENGGDD